MKRRPLTTANDRRGRAHPRPSMPAEEAEDDEEEEDDDRGAADDHQHPHAQPGLCCAAETHTTTL